ncbi:hypothetical protein [Nonomuraea cavernae]|uniref:Uncharacterized protein n=1 Tax=Nonomuraea cavernae TaxID=2045107 RepID=A0A917YPH6_9ACTN|nr:hypothetical protein [Nonomuraea cavernae]MCA2184632.1 hypothetical protein [Nonomuraea cavernae]GGO63216.1 hypothetical protein GCM10012289_09670 [Nonomuraea cavernae]
MSATYILDGVPLDHPAGCWRLKKGTQRRPLPGVRTVNLAVPGRSGDLPVLGLDHEAATLGLAFTVYPYTPSGADGGAEQMEHNLEALGALLGTRHRLMVLKWVTGSIVRVAGVTVEATSEPEYFAGAAMARLTAVVKIPEVYWRDEADSTWTGTLPGAGQIVTPLAGSTGPIVDSVLQVTGPAVQPAVRDVATGGTVAYTDTVQAGHHLLVDCGRLTAAIVTTDTWDLDAGTDVTSDINATGPGSAFRWLHLTPAMAVGDPHSRAVLVDTTASGTSAASQFEIRARRSYL